MEAIAPLGLVHIPEVTAVLTYDLRWADTYRGFLDSDGIHFRRAAFADLGSH